MRTLRPELPLLLVVMGIEFATIVDVILIAPLGVGLMRHFGQEEGWFGLVILATTLASAFCNVVGAGRVDRWDRRTVLLVLFAGFGLGELGSMLAPSAGAFLAARVLAGACTGLTASTANAIVADVVPPERHGAANGVVSSAYAAAFVLGVPAGVWLATHTSWRTAFAGLSVLVALLLVAALWVVPSVTGHLSARTAAPTGRVLWEVLRDGARTRVLALNGLLMFAAYVVTPLLPQYLVANLGVAEQDLPGFYLVGGVFTLVAAVATGIATDRVGAAVTLRVLAVLGVVPTVWVTLVGRVDLAYVAVTLFMAASTARVVPAVALAMASVPAPLRGATLSLSSAFQQGSLGIGAMVGAVLVSRGPDGLEGFVACGLLAAVATLAAIPLTLGVAGPPPLPDASR